MRGPRGGKLRRGLRAQCRQSPAPAGADRSPRGVQVPHQASAPRGGGKAGVECRPGSPGGGRRSSSAASGRGDDATGADARQQPPQGAARSARRGEAPTRGRPAAVGVSPPVGWLPAPAGPPPPSRPGVGTRHGVGPAHGPGGRRTPRGAPDRRSCSDEQSAATPAAARDGAQEGWGLCPGVLRRAGLSPWAGRRSAAWCDAHALCARHHRLCARHRERRHLSQPRAGDGHCLGLAALSAREGAHALVAAALWPGEEPPAPAGPGRAGAPAAHCLVAMCRDRGLAGRCGAHSPRPSLHTPRVYGRRDWG